MPLQKLYAQVMDRLRDSADATKVASVQSSDALLNAKSTHDLGTLQLIKEAVSAGQVAKLLGGGLLAGTGAAVPAYLAGRHLIQSGEEAAQRQQEEAAKNFRNKALQVALGVGGIGAGLMGLHHVLAGRRAAQQTQEQPDQEEITPYDESQAQQLAGLMPYYKEGSVQGDLLEKLAAVTYLDCVLEQAEKTGADKNATALRRLNAEHGTHILQQLLS